MTKWRYTDDSRKVVMREREDGKVESCLVSAVADWIGAGNTPEPAEPVNPNIAITEQIDALERGAMLNRGSRELELFLMEDRAAQVAAAKGVTVDMVLGANVYYVKLKALDLQIEALRGMLK